MEKSDGTMLCQAQCGASIAFTAVELETHDLRAWGPGWDPPPGTDKPMVADGRLSDPSISRPVGGAITDGASPVLLRLRGPGSNSGSLSTPLDQLEIGIYHQMRVPLPGATSNILPRRFLPEVGGLLAVPLANPSGGATPLPFQLPVVDTPPLPFPPPGMAVKQPVGAAGLLFYVPPEAFVDPRFVLPMGPSAAVGGEALPQRNALSSAETSPILFAARLGPNFVPGTRRFLLRRPPIVLVHGLNSSSSVWSNTFWTRDTPQPIPTRIQRLDYSATNLLGYTENYPKLATMIEGFLEEYRTAHAPLANSPNIPLPISFAATRADVVAHSMGGQIARWYIANTSALPAIIDRPGYGAYDLLNSRSEDAPDGRLPFLRRSNFGAGSIRRFITLDSPFKGSPLADLSDPLFAPGDALRPKSIVNDGTTWAMNKFGSRDTRTLSRRADLYPPTAFSDLSRGSAAQLALEGASYPASHKRVRWHPISCRYYPLVLNPRDRTRYWSDQFFLNKTTAAVELSEIRSDLVVTWMSQVNFGDYVELDPSPPSRGTRFNGIPHSDLVVAGEGIVAAGPTKRVEIKELVDFLISIKARYNIRFDVDPFPEYWSLGP